MIQARSIYLTFGSQSVFNNISFIINEHQRIGLVGANGAGKSTLLKVIMGQLQLDSGSITLFKGKRIAYMGQEVVLESKQSILEETFSSFTEIDTVQKEIQGLEQLIQEARASQNDIDKFASLMEALVDLNPELALAETKKTLIGLGFEEAHFALPVSQLSVGWKMRLILAKLLLQKADFYLFDEPTNHLDIFAKDWFLQFLQKASCGFLLVCHERYFLENVCDEILELEYGNAVFFQGNYSFYQEQKAHTLQLLEQAYIQQQKEIKQKQLTIDRFRASASRASMAKQMEKALDKVERIVMPPQARTIAFNFGTITQPGKTIATINEVSHAFDAKKLFENLSCSIERGEKVALIAPNGKGKTTLFNLIAGIYPLQSGTIGLGYNVKHAVFAQDQNKALNLKRTILDEVLLSAPHKLPEQVRSILGAFLFKRDDVEKKIQVLSGGEKNRVSLVKVLLQDANFLLLDEPTNHLDMQSKEILISTLQKFQGTIFFVSHDHDFINRLANRVIELTSDKMFSYSGDYDSYIYQKKTIEAGQKTATPLKTSSEKTTTQPSNELSLQKEHKALENSITKLEKEILALQAKFLEFDYGTPEFTKTEEKYNTAQKNLETLTAQWEASALKLK